jgi:endonuclease/exonuclease/phosphatase family metal-dependent hydrolase
MATEVSNLESDQWDRFKERSFEAAGEKFAPVSSGWDRTFLRWSSYAAEPICWAYGLLRYRLVAPLDPNKFDNFQNKIVEVAFRAFVVIAAIVTALPALCAAIVLGTTSKILRAIGFALQKNGYTYVRGQGPEVKLNGEAKILTWNLCGIGGGMSVDHGGVNHWRSRIDEIAARIVTEDPDVLILQEIYDTAFAEALIEKLGPHYAHFFTHLGANLMGSVSGGMVISRCAIHRFSNTSFDNNNWTLNRTFTTLDIKERPEDAAPAARIIGTHLIHDVHANKLDQLAQIINSVAKEKIALPTVLAGDLNLEKNNLAEGGVLDEFLIPSHGDEPTCTNEMVRQWDQKGWGVPGENIDCISLFKRIFWTDGPLPVIEKGIQMIKTHLVKAFDHTFNTRTALSDHHGLMTTLVWRPNA